MNKMMKWLFVAVAFTGMCACSGEDALQQSSQVETSSVSFSFFDSTVEKFGEANLSNGAMEANGGSITRAGDSFLTGDVQTRADDNTARAMSRPELMITQLLRGKRDLPVSTLPLFQSIPLRLFSISIRLMPLRMVSVLLLCVCLLASTRWWLLPARWKER